MFSITAISGKARTGILNTAHGNIETPFYMPVATKGAIKFLSPTDAEFLGYRCLISNALVNYFRPGLNTIEKAGGLHKFMNWPHPITTDSGGFQLLSESFLVKTSKEGAVFRNPYNGVKELITPEKLMDIQKVISSDIAMVLDDVPRFGLTHDDVLRAMINTHEWARRCKKHHTKKDQLLFGIAQGGTYEDLRRHSTKYISSLDFDGIALGGLAIGEPLHTMAGIISYSLEFTPISKPRYLMGVGSPIDMLEAISLGVDMFDSTFPTANARHNTLFTFNGNVRITNCRYKDDQNPIEKYCECTTCKGFSRSFIHHLMKNEEPLGKHLSTIHNLHFMNQLMIKTRKAIHDDKFDIFLKNFRSGYANNN